MNPNVGAEDGDFTLVQGEVNRGWGAMTDGSKRREESNPGEPVLKRADKKSPFWLFDVTRHVTTMEVSPGWPDELNG